MKRLLFFLFIIIIYTYFREDTEWTVLYGELNDNLAYKEINGNYYYENIEYFFIHNRTKRCYRNLDTNQFMLAKDLIISKLSQLDKLRTSKIFQEVKIAKQTNEYVNIEFTDHKGRLTLYKINLLDSIHDNVFVYVKHKEEYMECLWTDRKGKTRKTKRFQKIDR